MPALVDYQLLRGRPKVGELTIEKAGVVYSQRDIEVDVYLRTSNKRIAIGDVMGGYQFTHIASYHASIVFKNALFCLPAKVDYHFLPCVTFTLPEVSQAGFNEEQSSKPYGDKIEVLSQGYVEIDPAQAEDATKGMIKAIPTHKGKILGCSIVGRQAGELIQPWFWL